MNAGAIKDLYYEWYLIILSKLHEPKGGCKLTEFPDIMSSVNP